MLLNPCLLCVDLDAPLPPPSVAAASGSRSSLDPFATTTLVADDDELTVLAVPVLSVPKLYECQLPNSSWKQWTAPSVVSEWFMARWTPAPPCCRPNMLAIVEEMPAAGGFWR